MVSVRKIALGNDEGIDGIALYIYIYLSLPVKEHTCTYMYIVQQHQHLIVSFTLQCITYVIGSHASRPNHIIGGISFIKLSSLGTAL